MTHKEGSHGEELPTVDAVRSAAHRVIENAQDVLLQLDVDLHEVGTVVADIEKAFTKEDEWHFHEDAADLEGGPILTVQYLFVLDAINFCFWPSDGTLEYEELARGLKFALERDNSAFDSRRLQEVDARTIRSWMGGRELPLLSQRVRAVREVGHVLSRRFGGVGFNVVLESETSAVRFVDLIANHFPMWRDETVYDHRRVPFYKRAQILAADIWRTCHLSQGGKSHPACAWKDAERLTMFADYRVPQLLRHLGVVKYSSRLAASIIPHAARIIPQASIIPHAARIIPQASIIPHAARIIPQASIDRKAEVEAGSAAEVEIRAAAIVAVERIAQRLSAERAARPLSQGPAVSQSCVPPVFVDWALWAEGERRKDALPAHHRTTTTNY